MCASAILLLLVMLSGAMVTTNSSLVQPLTGGLYSSTAHRHFGTTAGAIAIALLAWASIRVRRVARVGWPLSALILAQALIGTGQASASAYVWMKMTHSMLAHLIIAGLVAVALLLSPLWEGDPEYVRDYGWPSMRSLAIALPVMLLGQIYLGAGYRQRMFGLMPHVIGAMIVSLVALMVGAFVLHQFPTHRILRVAARSLMVITFTQVFLGIAAFTVRALPELEPTATLIATASHVLTGALTFSASVVLGMLIRRNVQPKV
jgi:heme A synthase